MTKESNFTHSRIGAVLPTSEDCPQKAAFLSSRHTKPTPAFKPEPPKITGDARQYVPPTHQFGIKNAGTCAYCHGRLNADSPRWRTTCSEECKIGLKVKNYKATRAANR